ncbi:MAG TPA: hypothetical protein VK681_08335 [Reyranella sp.]|jgi:hypothetical protein|nr:hypothetical protein [Reyranella sp.]
MGEQVDVFADAIVVQRLDCVDNPRVKLAAVATSDQQTERAGHCSPQCPTLTNVGSDRDQLSDMTERARAAIGSEANQSAPPV